MIRSGSIDKTRENIGLLATLLNLCHAVTHGSWYFKAMKGYFIWIIYSAWECLVLSYIENSIIYRTSEKGYTIHGQQLLCICAFAV